MPHSPDRCDDHDAPGGHGRGPVDPRLMQLGKATRLHLGITVLLGSITAALVIAQAWLLSDVIARAFGGDVSVTDVRAPLFVLLLVVVARAAVAWYTEVSANRASSRVKSELRVALIEKLAADTPTLARHRMGTSRRSRRTASMRSTGTSRATSRSSCSR